MDKEKVRVLQKQIKEYIDNKEYDSAKKCYESQLAEMVRNFNSYNPKLEEYTNFLLEHYEKDNVSRYLLNQVNIVLSRNSSILMTEKYSLYMLAGGLEVKNKNIDAAYRWYERALDVCKKGALKSKNVENALNNLYDQYEKELDYLKYRAVKKVAEEIREARKFGENNRYIEAKTKQKEIGTRITFIEKILNVKRPMEVDKQQKLPECVILGCVVKVHDLEYDEYDNYTIVENDKANSLKNMISEDSPLGKALLGSKVGDSIIIKAPSGNARYVVKQIVDFREQYANPTKGVNLNEKSIISVETIDILPQNFVTRVTTFHCSAKDHDIRDILCRVKISRRSGLVDYILIPGAYCDTCKRYYILDREYEKMKLQGVPLCRIVEYDFWVNGNQSGFNGLNKESLLHMMGYNVNSQENLSTQQRWRILETIVDTEILSVVEIRSHLEWLIKRSYSLPKYKNARSKWEVDSKHIAEYEAENRRIVDAASITKKIYKQK